jgi:hypothetical protein
MSQQAERSRPVLVAGAPRTATTWVATALSLADGVTWINEPDNEWPNWYALKAKRRLGRFPALVEEDADPRRYLTLWRRSLAGRRQGRYQEAMAWKLDRGERTVRDLWLAMCEHPPKRLPLSVRLFSAVARPPRIPDRATTVMVKSVHAPLALEWIAARLEPRMVVVLRHPLNVIASWSDLGWGGCALVANPRIRERFGRRWNLPELERTASPLAQAAWEVGLFTCALEAGAERSDWLVASHDRLCLGPRQGFRDLFARLGLTWSERVEAFLTESNRPGAGFTTFRVAADEPDRWRKRLSPEQIREAWSVLSRIEAPWVERVAQELE